MTKAFREIIGIAPSTASTSDSVLLIIDAQNEYINGLLKTENVDSSRQAIVSLLAKYRAANAPIVHIVHETPAQAPVFTPGTDLAKEFAELEPKSGEHAVTKLYPGSFAGTDLDEIIKKTGRNKLVLTGYMAHVCVSTTARQAAQRGYDVIVAEDAVGDRNIPGVKAEDLVRIVLAELGDAFGTIVRSENIN
ncbi:uncharacterized protein BP5553_01653 [Venustampulla echinocandica]|uniref:Isochorismatase-like domain-containing protein n=1 Tax=Venustampulla echinocandica TaxID=2656787 RepID=A0A370U1M6_9HELO|nr:uncharacterized protein BP5553_01653 [Venustampulla echinocandica]RDL41674.1 hypothetical protein BP5553_01653 [Venustampulla echinocandica]